MIFRVHSFHAVFNDQLKVYKLKNVCYCICTIKRREIAKLVINCWSASRLCVQWGKFSGNSLTTQKIYDFFKTLFTFPFGLTTSSNYGRLCWKFASIQCIRMKVIQSYGAENLLHYQIEKDHCYFWPHTHNNDADYCFSPISHFFILYHSLLALELLWNVRFQCVVFLASSTRNEHYHNWINFSLTHSKTTTNSPAYITFCSVHLEWFHVVFPKWNIYQDE